MLQPRLASINNYGATTWSDGFTSIIGLGHRQDIAVCPSCEGIFWIEDAMQIGIMHSEPESTAWPAWKRALGHFNKEDASTLAKERAWKGVPDSWHWAGKIESIRGRELVWALEHGLGNNPERELILRRKLWWAGNHADRGSTLRNPMTARQTCDNLEGLLAAITRNAPEAPTMPMVEAELLRQLQRFDEALAIVDDPAFADDDLAKTIATNARLRNTKVCIVSSWSIAD
jgi:hypothetical protein